MEKIKPGARFANGSMDLTVLCFTESKDSNLVLVINSNDGLFITARNLQPWQSKYTWDWGYPN